jgi:Penicillin V acylase and related amidases
MIKGSVVNDQGKDEYTVYTACYSSGSKTYYCNFEDDFELKTYQLDDKTMNSTGLITY